MWARFIQLRSTRRINCDFRSAAERERERVGWEERGVHSSAKYTRIGEMRR